MKLRTIGLLAAAVLSFGANNTAQAATVFSDNFNGENGGVGGLNYNGFANWDVTNGTVDLIGNGFFDFYPTNGLYVDLDGSSNDAGVFTTKQTFDPGDYLLQFALGNSPYGNPNTVTVTLGSFVGTFTRQPGDSLGIVSQLISTTGGKLSFSNAGGDNIGAILDNVELATVPTPALLPGLIGLSVAALRRRKGEVTKQTKA